MSKHTKYNKAPHTVDVSSIHEDYKSTRRDSNDEARWVDGSKYGRTFYIEGVTDNGTEYNARVGVLIQTWEDINAEGQFVHTTNVVVERFFDVNGYIPTPEGRGIGWNPSQLTEEELNAEDIAQEQVNLEVTRYLNAVEYSVLSTPDDARLPFATGARAILDAIKRAAVYSHLNLR
jgi:hypothetical protein